MIEKTNQISTLYSIFRHPHVTRAGIVAFQNKQLRRLICHAYENVPYYRNLFHQNGIKPQDIRTAADLSAIPTTSSKDLQTLSPQELISRGVNIHRLFLYRTSGSSGRPVSVRRTWSETQMLSAFRLRAMRYSGLKVRDRLAIIRDIHPDQPRNRWNFYQIIKKLGLYRILVIDCLQDIEDILQTLRHFRPDVIGGYPALTSRLAEFMGDRNNSMIRPRFLVTGAEVLAPAFRKKITEAFEAPVFDHYGSWEFDLLAWECKETGEFHICDDSVIIEILKDGRPAMSGERGEVVGTNLHSFAMPFIRYRLGDIVTKGSETCGCGQPFSTINKIQGRMLDFFPLPDGRIMDPFIIKKKVIKNEDYDRIRQFQLVQEDKGRIILKIAVLKHLHPEKLDQMHASAMELLGDEVEFRIVQVPEINFEPSGKLLNYRSLVRSEHDEIKWDD